MDRSNFQVLVIPFRINGKDIPEFAVTKRSDMNAWQFLSGGGESGETPIQAAKREACEEGGISHDKSFIGLDSTASIPAIFFAPHKEWTDDIYVIPEYTFGVEITGNDLVLGPEHTEFQWLLYDLAIKRLTWDSNRTALWELNERINNRLGRHRFEREI